ncbi:MAG: hypothetical protein HY761_09045 [Candidatus Omnitrophica bacterium]|nr:hypothetical protein [Candidatus Omnitrophota bacterium]
MSVNKQVNYLDLFGTTFSLVFFGAKPWQREEIDQRFSKKCSQDPQLQLSFFNAASCPTYLKKASEIIKKEKKTGFKEFLKKNPEFIIYDRKRHDFYYFFDKRGSLNSSVLLAAEGCFYYLGRKLGTIFLHSAGVCLNKHAYLFLAPSGGGKSTLAKLAKKNRLKVLSEELLLVKQKHGGFYAYKFPSLLPQKGPLIKGLFFLKKGHTLKIQKISLIKSLAKAFGLGTYLLSAAPGRDLPLNRKHILNFLEKMFSCVKPYELVFRKSDNVFRVIGENSNEENKYFLKK